jgi:chaperonin cofactor prefoldin
MGELVQKKQEQIETSLWNTERVNELLRRIDEEGLDYKDVDNPFYEQDPELKKPNLRPKAWPLVQLKAWQLIH